MMTCARRLRATLIAMARGRRPAAVGGLEASARYTLGDGIKTAVTALIVGMAAGAFYVLPAVVTVPVLCAYLYWCGVMDGRANRRGGRAVEFVRQRLAGGRS